MTEKQERLGWESKVPAEEYLPDVNTVSQRRFYDPFVEKRAEMRGSSDPGERACGFIAGCWPEATAIVIADISPALWESWKRDHPDMYALAYELAKGMIVAEIRAAGLGLINRRNQKTMALHLARMMKLKELYIVGGSIKDDGDDSASGFDTDAHDIGNMTPEEMAALANLEDPDANPAGNS